MKSVHTFCKIETKSQIPNRDQNPSPSNLYYTSNKSSSISFHKKIYKEGGEPEVEKINNSCRTSLMAKMKAKMPSEYEEVKRDPVFAHILAIYENELHYSGKLIHNFLCKQLGTTKLHELWFEFARRPLQFSLQEFHAVFGLNCVKADNLDIEGWIDDGGFWSKMLKKKQRITLVSIKSTHLVHIHNWSRGDRVRLVYLCVIVSLLQVTDPKTVIDHSYTKLVIGS